MNIKAKVSLIASTLLFATLGLTVGCGKPSDSKIASDVQQRIAADSGLRNKQIGVESANGVVTLSGNVDDLAQFGAAASYASSVKGVKQVVNNLQVPGSPEAPQTQAAGRASSGDASAPAPPPAAADVAPTRTPIPAGTPTPDVIHKKLAAFVYPANNQTPDQQQYDEMDCYNWAKSQTSIDPLGPATAVQQVEKGANEAQGSRVRGAARGAAGGALVGAITGDAGKGAAIGATLGTMRGGRAVRQGKAQAEQDYQQAQAQAQQQAAATDRQKIATFKKAFSVCVQGRGYSVQ